MAPEKHADLKGMAQMFKEEGCNEFLARMRRADQGGARRKQIMSVTIGGDHAVLEARDDPNTITDQYLELPGLQGLRSRAGNPHRHRHAEWRQSAGPALEPDRQEADPLLWWVIATTFAIKYC
jgi:hypothetical protein